MMQNQGPSAVVVTSTTTGGAYGQSAGYGYGQPEAYGQPQAYGQP